ncbi:MAG: HlyD family efflux transporter periplasmic adaptor subunit [Desulfovibrio sp.]|uniref:efflux RND transporter periplasmic adaptor subunit n=1 Tax=Desulfovibrio sp. TaxID=885 RepID=UPI0039E23F43
MSMQPDLVNRLALLLKLEQRARHCEDRLALGFVMVNETNSLVAYRQAVLWTGEIVDGSVEGSTVRALSGLADPAQNAPFTMWLSEVLRRHAAASHAARANDDSAALLLPQAGDKEMWHQYLPEHALWLPLPLKPNASDDAGAATKKSTPLAALVLCREEPWTQQDISLLTPLTDAYAHAWLALRGASGGGFMESGWRGLVRKARHSRWRLAVALVLLLVSFFPVRQSVLAPAEIVPRNPSTVRASLHGVVDRITVQPNAPVQKGDLLVLLDAQDIKGKLEAARQSLAVAQAELRQAQQQALFDERSKATVGILRGQKDQAASDVIYLESMLERTEIRAEVPGIAVFDDPQEWSGRPVALGERIMVIANPQDVELEAHVALADAIPLHPGAEVRLFMNAAPASPVDASLERVGYRAVPVADGTLAYRTRATFDSASADEKSTLRIGLKGTAKLYGQRTFLLSYLLRRPLATARLWLGL